MKLIVGLGNPGTKYEKTRHNVGFRVLDALAASLGFQFESKKKFLSEIAKNSEIILAKPQTFMNDSGQTVQKLLAIYKLQLTDLLVIHDEVDLPLGTIRLSRDASSAGHKGVASVIDVLGTKNFARLRIGVESRSSQDIPPTDDYVLQNFPPDEEKILKETVMPSALKEIGQFFGSKIRN